MLSCHRYVGLLGLSCAACSGFPASLADSLGGGRAVGAGGTDAAGGASGSGGEPSDDSGSSGGGGAAGSAGAELPAVDSGAYPRSCDDLGPEPTLPPPCATLVATKATVDGKPSDESIVDTQQIQAAITACSAGQAVKLTADADNNAFVSGALFMKAGVALWIDAGVTLFATRNPRDFDAVPTRCGLANTSNAACLALINVRSAAGVSVVGAGTIDGRGGEPVAGGVSTWWVLENAADGTLAAPRLVQVSGGSDFSLYQVTLRNAAKFHVVIDNTVGFRVWGVTVNTPASAPNTDGIDPSASINGVIAYSNITTGDDNVAIKGAGPRIVDNIVIAHNHFGRGHGMSIGSETNGGVRNVRVCDLSLDGTQNGLRIKSDSSRGGLVRSISYSDICMRGVRNPLVFDPYYSDSTGTLFPDYEDIVVRNMHMLGGGTLTLAGYDAAHPLTLTLDNVVFDTAPSTTAQSSEITLGPGPVNFAPAGTDVSVTRPSSSPAEPRVCDNAWFTF